MDLFWRLRAMERWQHAACSEEIPRIYEGKWRDIWIASSIDYSWESADGEHSKILILSNNNKSVKRPESQGRWPVAHTKQRYHGGPFFVKVDSPSRWVGNQMSLGLATPEMFDKYLNQTIGGLYNVIGKSGESVGYVRGKSNKGHTCLLYYQGVETPLENYETGDIVGFMFDFKTNEIVFMKNGKEQIRQVMNMKPTDYYNGFPCY